MNKLIIITLIFFSFQSYGQVSFLEKANTKKHLRITLISAGVEYESFLTEKTSMLIGAGFTPTT